MSGERWSAEEFERAKHMLATGVQMGVIAASLGRSFNSVAYKLREHSRELEGARRFGLLTLPEPATFCEALKRFPSYTSSAQWLGAERGAVKSMSLRDWVPRRYWPGLLNGLREECGSNLTESDLEAWATERGRWDRPTPKPQDWSDLPKHERAIARIIQAKTKDRALADEAAGYAILEMMEYAKPHLGYGVRCAFNYVKDHHNKAVRTRCLSDDELHAAMDLRMHTPANQLHALELRDVFNAARQLPRPYDKVFQGIVLGHSDQIMADALGLSASHVSGLKTHCRRLLREFSSYEEAA